MCHARPVEPLIIVVLVILLAVAVWIAVSRGRDLEEIRGLTKSRAATEDPARQVRRLMTEADAAARELDHARS